MSWINLVKSLDAIEEQLATINIASMPKINPPDILNAAARRAQPCGALDLDEPNVTDDQIWFEHEIRVNGIAGLSWAMSKSAKKKAESLSKTGKMNTSTWKPLFNKENDIGWMMILCVMEFEVVVAMVSHPPLLQVLLIYIRCMRSPERS